MGYRLEINVLNENNSFETLYYGTKLYGYDLELDCSLSYEFLKVIGKFDGDEYFDYGIENQVILSYNELLLFLKLYNLDYNKYGFYKEKTDCFLNDETIKDLINNVGKYEYCNFLIEWN